jgi:streptomycin 6-kinase
MGVHDGRGAAFPPEMARRLLARRGPDAASWVAELPAALAAYARRWSLTLGQPVEPISYNFVIQAASADGEPLILKLGKPEGDPAFDSEAEALRRYAGRGCALLRQADRTPTMTALLLERIVPGLPLSTVEDDTQATLAAAGLMRRLWRPLTEPVSLPTIATWARGLDRHRSRFGGSGPIPARLFEAAVALYRDLGATMAEPVLLHGDLHHDNILSATREPWLAIDPKGLIGEPAYEVGALLRNPHDRLATLPDAMPLQARRITVLADELSLDPGRVRDWGLAQAVLSACWTLEDGEGARQAAFMIGVAEALSRVRV